MEVFVNLQGKYAVNHNVSCLTCKFHLSKTWKYMPHGPSYLFTAVNHRFSSETDKYEHGVRHETPKKKRRQLINKANGNVMSRRSGQQSWGLITGAYLLRHKKTRPLRQYIYISLIKDSGLRTQGRRGEGAWGKDGAPAANSLPTYKHQIKFLSQVMRR